MSRQLLRWLPAIVIAATVLYTLSLYPSLPAQMPTHWGVNGQVNGWSPRAFGAWLLPAIMVLPWGISLIVPAIDAQKAADEKVMIALQVITAAMVTFMAVVQAAMLNVALGHHVDMTTLGFAGVGVLFTVIGLALKPGVLMIGAGLAITYSALVGPPTTTFVVLLVSSSVAAVGTIYLASRVR